MSTRHVLSNINVKLLLIIVVLQLKFSLILEFLGRVMFKLRISWINISWNFSSLYYLFSNETNTNHLMIYRPWLNKKQIKQMPHYNSCQQRDLIIMEMNICGPGSIYSEYYCVISRIRNFSALTKIIGWNRHWNLKLELKFLGTVWVYLDTQLIMGEE